MLTHFNTFQQKLRRADGRGSTMADREIRDGHLHGYKVLSSTRMGARMGAWWLTLGQLRSPLGHISITWEEEDKLHTLNKMRRQPAEVRGRERELNQQAPLRNLQVRNLMSCNTHQLPLLTSRGQNTLVTLPQTTAQLCNSRTLYASKTVQRRQCSPGRRHSSKLEKHHFSWVGRCPTSLSEVMGCEDDYLCDLYWKHESRLSGSQNQVNSWGYACGLFPVLHHTDPNSGF